MAKKKQTNKQKSEVSRKQAIKILWNKGILKWKLHVLQKKIYDDFYGGNDYTTTLLISRQTGKSFFCCVLAIETCLRKPNAIVKYACPKQKMVKTILKPIMRQILEDCPPELRPEYYRSFGYHNQPFVSHYRWEIYIVCHFLYIQVLVLVDNLLISVA